VFTRHYDSPPLDPEWQLYSGGFFSAQDKALMQTLQQAAPEQLAALAERFSDPRLPDMLFRYRARNYPDSLSSQEQQQWHHYCTERLQHSPHPNCLDCTAFNNSMRELENTLGADHAIFKSLRQFALKKAQHYQLQAH
jgi:exodeoxyribonuclease-1